MYGFKNQQDEIEIPFAEYMEKYTLIGCSPSEELKRTKQVMNIKAHIDYLIDNNGIYNLPDKIQQYVDRSFGILKIKEGKALIRIAFVTIPNESVVLLNATDKPALYDKAKKLRVDKHIQLFLDESENYRNDYLKNNLTIPFFDN
jgi:hypothetical protein